MNTYKTILQQLPRYMRLEDNLDLIPISNALQGIFDDATGNYNNIRIVYPTKLNFINFFTRYLRGNIPNLPIGIERLDNPITTAYTEIDINDGDDYEVVIPYNILPNDRLKIQKTMELINPFNRRYTILYLF